MPHPESDRLRRAMERCAPRAAPWSGVVYRSASPRSANSGDLLTGAGSKVAGARWNPPRSFPTVYASLDPHTALDEVLAHFRHYALPIESAMPRVTVAVRAELSRALDLTNGATRSALRVSARRMLREPWRAEQAAGREALTQALGRLAHELGWEALVVPSAARRGGVNLIIFPDNLARRGALEIVNVGELPARPQGFADLHADS
jgi:RES domain-containing protein